MFWDNVNKFVYIIRNFSSASSWVRHFWCYKMWQHWIVNDIIDTVNYSKLSMGAKDMILVPNRAIVFAVITT